MSDDEYVKKLVVIKDNIELLLDSEQDMDLETYEMLYNSFATINDIIHEKSKQNRN